MPTEIKVDLPGVVLDTQRHPQARPRSVAVAAVKLLPDFLHDRISVNGQVTLAQIAGQLPREGVFDRFRTARDPATYAKENRSVGEAQRCKWLGAAATTLPAGLDPELASMIEHTIYLVRQSEFDEDYIGLTIPPDQPE